MDTRPTVTLPVRWPKRKKHHCVFCPRRASHYDLFCESHWREINTAYNVEMTPDEAAYDAEQLAALFGLSAPAQAVAR